MSSPRSPGAWPEEALHPLAQGFLASVARVPHRIALEVAGQRFTYCELWDLAAGMAATLQGLGSPQPPLTAVCACRTPIAYAGILAALLRGNGYVPLNPRFPVERNRSCLQQTRLRELIVDSEGEKSLVGLLSGLSEEITVLLPESATVRALQQRWPQHRFLGSDQTRPASALKPCAADLDAVAYVLFTSGSTGQPKGVQISHRSVSHLLRTMVARYAISELDRVSQFADLTFDPSVFDVFAAWECGAALCCPSLKSLLNPGPFLSDQAITIFQSVPSNGLLMRRLGALKPGRFPNLRVILFGGEALPMELCRSWQPAAPSAIIENLYGPTEVTINSTACRWDGARSPAECLNGIVPIGSLLPGVRGLVVDEQLLEVPDGQKGELLLAGPQRSSGYVNDLQRTAQAMVTPPGKSEPYYRTGDLVSKAAGTDWYSYHGRMDFQVKIFGMRIELGEIEAALREESGEMEVAVLGWPVTATGVGGLVAFLAGANQNPERLMKALHRRLPQQMVPRTIRVLERLPLNGNGKVDRLQLRHLLKTSPVVVLS